MSDKNNSTMTSQELLEMDPYSLPNGPKSREKAEEGGGSAQNPVMPVAMAVAASRLAEGKSLSYVPSGAAPAVQNMAVSAQHNLGIEEVNGFQMNGPNPGGNQLPMGSGDEKKGG